MTSPRHPPSMRIVTLSSKGQFTLRKRERHHLGVAPRGRVELTIQHGQLLIRRRTRSLTAETAGSLARYARSARREATPA